MGAFVAWDYIAQFGTRQLAGLTISGAAASDFKWDEFPHGCMDLPTLHLQMSAVQADKEAFLIAQRLSRQGPCDASTPRPPASPANAL
jgi:hypothetical protein